MFPDEKDKIEQIINASLSTLGKIIVTSHDPYIKLELEQK